jgi:hypothetical protein
VAEEMTGDRAPRWLPSIRTAVRLCLLAQVVVAGAIVSEHLWEMQLRLAQDGIERVPTDPVSPGDQTRPYAPAAVPAHGPGRHVDTPVRLPQTIPVGLTFAEQETVEFGRVLLVSGSIEPGDALRFIAHVESMPEPPPTVALHSPGGVVAEAQRIGRFIRERGMDTLIAPDAACLSSCPYMLAGGAERTVSRTGWVGLHQHYHDRKTILPAFLAVQGIQDGQGDTLAYLGEMGIDPLILVHVLKTPPDDIYLLVEEELLDYRLATEVVD